MSTLFWSLISLVGLIVGAGLLAVVKFKRAQLDMSFMEFARRLIKGGGFMNISPYDLEEMLIAGAPELKVIDLRDQKDIQKTPFPNATASSFDIFLKEVVVDEKYSHKDPIVLICDTGQMSRVAANILVEDEGFTDVFNLQGGVARWKRWQARSAKSSSRACRHFRTCCDIEDDMSL